APLAVRTACDRRVVDTHYRSRNRTGSTDSGTEIVAAEIFEDLLERPEKECLVPDNRSADASAGLFAAEILKRFAVGGIGGQAFEFAPENGSVSHREFIQRDAGLHSCHFDWLSGNRHLFRYAGYSHRDWQR